MRIKGEKTLQGKEIITSSEFLDDLIKRIDSIIHFLEYEKDNDLKFAYLIGAIEGLTLRLNRVCHEELIFIGQERKFKEDLIELACVELNKMQEMIGKTQDLEMLKTSLLNNLFSLKNQLKIHVSLKCLEDL
ncbi:MAG: hypothetical protein ACTSU4_07760 [Promethearchaeota archaeon]